MIESWLDISYNSGACNSYQIINFNNYALSFDDIQTLQIYDARDNLYQNVEYAYSDDDSCWSCFMSLDSLNSIIVNKNSDMFVKCRVKGLVGNVKLNGNDYKEYSTSLDTNFNYTTTIGNSNTFDPYANMNCAIGLQQQLSETVASMFGIPIYYFKLNPNKNSKDITFKNYALMNVEAVKQIKLIVANGQMPSSKPEFQDFGFEFETDWVTEISKGMFATAFGNNAQPMEGDLIYIPMMKRMWMVNEAYEERNEGLMWTGSTFKVALVKYQEKDSVDLGDTQDFVDTLVKNKYDDLFADEGVKNDSQSDAVDAPKYVASNAVPIFESDAMRKTATIDNIEISMQNKLYHNGALVSDNQYKFNKIPAQIVYQNKYCGNAATISFIINAFLGDFEGNILTIGKWFAICLKIENNKATIYSSKDKNISINIDLNSPYLIIFRWSEELNIIDITAYPYSYNKQIPRYKLTNSSYYFDLEKKISQIYNFNPEFIITDKSEVAIEGINGWLTNIKVFDFYNSDINEIIQTYPNNQHLLINDTARQIITGPGVVIR